MSSTHLKPNPMKTPSETKERAFKNPYPEFFSNTPKSEIFGRFSSRNSGDENQ